jgi:hypothetical protein
VTCAIVHRHRQSQIRHKFGVIALTGWTGSFCQINADMPHVSDSALASFIRQATAQVDWLNGQLCRLPPSEDHESERRAIRDAIRELDEAIVQIVHRSQASEGASNHHPTA